MIRYYIAIAVALLVIGAAMVWAEDDDDDEHEQPAAASSQSVSSAPTTEKTATVQQIASTTATEASQSAATTQSNTPVSKSTSTRLKELRSENRAYELYIYELQLKLVDCEANASELAGLHTQFDVLQKRTLMLEEELKEMQTEAAQIAEPIAYPNFTLPEENLQNNTPKSVSELSGASITPRERPLVARLLALIGIM
jgi:hypothetical protein